MATLDASALKSDPKGMSFLRVVLTKAADAGGSNGRLLSTRGGWRRDLKVESDMRRA